MVEAAPKKIQVAEMGNKRKEISDEDVTQCIKDLASWFQSNGADHHSSKMAPAANAASEAQVDEVLAVFGASPHLRLSLQKFNGGIHYMDTFIGLSVEQIRATG